MKNLQEMLLVACFQRMEGLGWRVLQTEGLTATLAPTRRPLGNNAWGEATFLNLARCHAFFNGRPYSWLLESDADPARLLVAGFRRGDATPEMVLADLTSFSCPAVPGIRVEETGEDLAAWSALLGESFAMPPGEVREFFEPLVLAGQSTPLLGFLDGEPAGTAELQVDLPWAALYGVSTLPRARRRGLGRALVGACVARARKAGAVGAVLYSSPMGVPLYEQCGFRTVQVLQEYLSPGHP